MKLLTLLGILVLWASSDVSGSDQKTTAGGYCTFPFIYKNVQYHSCTTKNHNRPWCATTKNYDKERMWGNCEGFSASGVRTTARDACAFPFTYEGVVYKSCTSKNRNRPWCSTTVNFDEDSKWGSCAGYTSSGLITITGQYCVFPFRYNGVRYWSCTTKGDNKPWCATTADYNKDYKMGECAGFHAGARTTSGGYCALPFVYRGNIYNTCISKYYSGTWCATTTNYDEDKKWGTCA